VTDGKLSPLFVEWMMGLEEGHVTDVAASRAKALACLGNGVVPHQAKKALELLT
jgi:DNA (cytosine-5)-methyltransferase 1